MSRRQAVIAFSVCWLLVSILSQQVCSHGISAAENRHPEKIDYRPGQGKRPFEGWASSLKTSRAKGAGSGFIVSFDGHILTCDHVIKKATIITARFDGNFLPASVVYRDVDNDLALLKISGIFPALALSARPKSSIGEEVFTVGYPDPHRGTKNGKLSTGVIVSTVSDQEDVRLYQVDVPIRPGNSGGPLLDMHGNVIGIVAAMISNTRLRESGRPLLQNVSFAINSRYAWNLLNRFPTTSEPQAPTVKKEPFKNVVQRVRKSVVMIVAF